MLFKQTVEAWDTYVQSFGAAVRTLLTPRVAAPT